MPSGTLGFLIDDGHGLEAICEAGGCGHVRALDIAALADREGRDLTLEQLRPRLRCGRCGARAVRLEPFATGHGLLR